MAISGERTHRGCHPNKIQSRFRRVEPTYRESMLFIVLGSCFVLDDTLYFGRWNKYSSFFRDTLAWIAAFAAYVALILTIMQVGLATRLLQNSPLF